jgi:hypothetical protein
MAPHAEATLIDTSGYTPSSDAIRELKALLELDPPTLPNRVTNGAQCIDSHDRDEFPRDWILQLSLNHLQEIEDAIVVFESLYIFFIQVTCACSPTATKIRSFHLTSCILKTSLCQHWGQELEN